MFTTHRNRAATVLHVGHGAEPQAFDGFARTRAFRREKWQRGGKNMATGYGLALGRVHFTRMQFASEFADEYGDWLSGSQPVRRARWLDLTLADLPREVPLCVEPGLSVRSVVELMKQAGRSAVLVLSAGEVHGIFTERDVLSRVVASDGALERPVSALMTKAPHVLTERTQLGAALRILALGSYHHLPVVDALGHPLGLVSLQSIMSYLADQFPTEILNAPPEEDSFPRTPEGG